MIREIIVTSPQGVRLAFTADGEQGLELQRHGPTATVMDIADRNKPCDAGYMIVGVVPTSWLVELNETVT